MTDATQWLLCDYGNVLAYPPTPYDTAGVVKLSGLSEADIRKSYWAFRQPYDASLTLAGYWSSLIDDAALVQEIVRRELAGWSRPMAESVDAVRAARDRGFRLAVFSNAPAEFEAAFGQTPWLEMFEHIFVSSQVGAKPDPEAFEKVLAALGAEATDVTFVDDRPENVEGARSLGMRAVLFTHPSQIDELTPLK